MGIFDLFKKKPELEPINLSTLGVDMHSHLIPGIDDGSKSMDETIAMLAKFEALGYRKIITTPHILSDYYKNTPEIILGGLEKVRETAKKLNLTIEIEAAAEYYFDEYFVEQIRLKNILSFGENFVLLEFAFMDEPFNIESVFFDLQSAGYQPILAHFERYTYWHGSIDKAIELRERGVKIQLNLNSLTGHYGPDVKKQAQALVDAKLVDFAGSDCHRIQHLMLLESNLKNPYFHKLLENPLLNSQL